MRAKTNSIHIRNNQAAINLSVIDMGFFVETGIPEKNDWEIPMYNIGSMLTTKINAFITQI